MPGGMQMLPLIVGSVEDKSGADGAGPVATLDGIEDAELIPDPTDSEDAKADKPEEPAKT